VWKTDTRTHNTQVLYPLYEMIYPDKDEVPEPVKEVPMLTQVMTPIPILPEPVVERELVAIVFPDDDDKESDDDMGVA